MRPLCHLTTTATLLALANTAGAQQAPQQPAEQQPSSAPQAAAAPALTKLPEVISSAEAEYPALALAHRIAARVVLQLDLGANGAVERSSVVELVATTETGEPVADPSQYEFEAAATAAASQLKFSPAEAGGITVPVAITYTFNFQPPQLAPLPIAPLSPASTPPAKPTPIAAPAPQPKVNFAGQLLERGTRGRIAAVLVTAYRSDQAFEVLTDTDGRFQFYDLAAGSWKVAIEASGYHRYATSETIASGERVDTRYYLERSSDNPYDVLVEADRPKKEVNRRSLDTRAIVKVPGTLGDPVLAVENLPGVARAMPGTGEIMVRGSGPYDTGIYIDGIAIPLIYHFGGLRSVVPADVVEGIDFYPGNYSVAYGRAMGGVFNLRIKRLAPDRAHGSLDVSMLDTSLYVESPLGDNAAIAIAGRRSYIDVVLNALVPEDSSVGLVSAPVYYDLQLLGSWRPRPAHELRWLLMGANDKLELLFHDPAEVSSQLDSGNVAATSAFQRATFDYRYAPSASFRNDLRIGIGRNEESQSLFGQFRADFEVYQVQLKETASWKLGDKLSVSAGLDALYSSYTGEVLSIRPPEEGAGSYNPDLDDTIYTEFENRGFLYAAPFAEANINIGNLQLVPGLRSDYFSRIDQLSVDPRLVARYQRGDWTAKGGAAVVHQEPTVQQTDDAFGNPDLGLQTAYQYSVGGEWRPRDYLMVDATVFYKDMNNLVSPTGATAVRDGESLPQVYNNGGSGRVYGFELFAEHKFSNRFRGWLSYTLSKAERTDSGEQTARAFDFDQTHILGVVGSYLLPRNWELGLRWRFVTGNPTTPVIGSTFVSDLDSYAPVMGAVNSDRLPSFHQLDLRVDKSWLFQTWKLSAYLSLTNAYNRKNVEGISYNYDFSQQGSTNGLPLLPILGLRGAF